MRKLKILQNILLTINEGISPSDDIFIKTVLEYGFYLNITEQEVKEVLKMSIGEIIENK